MAQQHIVHGDSRAVLSKLRTPVNCIITDPPFGIDNQSNSATTAEGKFNARKIANDETPEVAMNIFREVMDVLLPKTATDADLYIFTSHQVLGDWISLADSLAGHGFKRSGILVWQKDGPGMGDLDSWGMGHEFIIFLKKGHRLRTDERRSGVIHIPQVRPKDLIHPHQKPLPLLELLIKHSTNREDLIVDPFAGSGSTIRAAKNLGRNGLGVEYDQLNYDRAVKALTEISGFDF